MKSLIGVALLVVLTISAWLVWPDVDNRDRRLMVYDGTKVPDLPAADSRGFAGDEYAGVRQVYLANLQVYRSWAMTPIPSDPRRARLSLPDSFAGLDDMPDLFYRVGIVLGRAGGMALEQYQSHADPRLIATIGCCGGASPTAFEGMYESASKQPRLVGYAADVDGVRASFGHSLPADSDDLLLEALSADERDYMLFRGPISQSAILFHGHPNMANLEKEILRFAVISVVVEDDTGDRFPLWMSFFWDQEGHRWWMYNVYRMVSVRVAARERQLVY